MTVHFAVSPAFLANFIFENPVAGEKLIRVHTHAWMATIYLFWTPGYLFSRISGETFSCSFSAGLALELPVSSSVIVIAPFLPHWPDSWQGLRGERHAYSLLPTGWSLRLAGGCPTYYKDVQILSQYNAPVSLSESLPTVVVQSKKIVEPRIDLWFPVQHIMGCADCNRMSEILFLVNYLVLLQLSSVK